MLTSYLYSIVLAGIFAAVAELFLPSRIFSVGRLLRAVCSVFVVFCMVSPILSVFSSTDLSDSFESSDLALEEETNTCSVGTHIEQRALSALAERLRETVAEKTGREARVEVFFKEDINTLFADIYCDISKEEALALVQDVRLVYGLESAVVSEGSQYE